MPSPRHSISSPAIAGNCIDDPGCSRRRSDPIQGVGGLRVKLLEAARKEQERCLQSKENLFRYRRQVEHVAVQTEPVLPLSASGSLSSEQRGSGWTQEDDSAQAEAIRAIQALRSRNIADVSCEQLRDELTEEHRLRMEAQDQVRRLEAKLECMESAVKSMEHTLERRDQDWAQMTALAQHQESRTITPPQMNQPLLSSTKMGNCGNLMQPTLDTRQLFKTPQGPGDSTADEYGRVKALRNEILELEHHLQMKNLQVARLYGTQCLDADDASTLCSSVLSVSRRTSLSSTRGRPGYLQAGLFGAA